MNLTRWVAVGLVAVSMVGCGTFLFLYQRWYPWWRSEAGRHLFVFAAVLGAFDTAILMLMLVPSGWRPVVQVLLLLAYTPQPVVVWWRVSMLRRVHTDHPDAA